MVKTSLFLIIAGGLACAQTVVNGGRTVLGSWDASSAASTAPNRAGAGSPAGRDKCSKAGETYFQTDGAGQNLWTCAAPGTPGTWIPIVGAGVRTRMIGWAFDGGGSALTAGRTAYIPWDTACTISRWDLTVDTGTATVDVWKTADGTTLPAVANSITAAATPSISSGSKAHGTTLTGWATSVAPYDTFAFNLKAVSGATQVTLILECDQ